MRTVKTLIAECVKMCGTQSALAKMIGSTQQDVHKWTTGKRPISPATVGHLCDLLGLDGEEARRLAAEAVIEAARPEKQGVLRRAFFVSGNGGLCGAGLLDTNDELVTKALLVVTAAIEVAMRRESDKSDTGAKQKQLELCQLWSSSKSAPLCET